MTTRILFDQTHIVGPWVCEHAEGRWYPDRGAAIGIADETGIIGGVIYDDYTGPNGSIQMHVASNGSKRWMTRQFLHAIFAFPFEQLKVNLIVGVTPSFRVDALRFIRHIGFVQSAILQDAHPQGDLIISTLRREHCRWLHLPRVRFPEHG